eukprot:TRINITY_DN7095_c0_g1_i1.p1 TRINITY_DN7095_c0_g1~~TRINITY_DN7095_c0_g1_i1.p1  ORF type:complete len:248 (+),score=54.25 TRINITY_DN7095_c0_g1_i1:31-774(+)
MCIRDSDAGGQWHHHPMNVPAMVTHGKLTKQELTETRSVCVLDHQVFLIGGFMSNILILDWSAFLRRKMISAFSAITDRRLILAEIISVEQSAKFITYVIKVRTSASEWTVKRRYSEFLYLHDQLELLFAQVPKVPPKKWIFNKDASFVEKRRRKLEKFLQRLLMHSRFRETTFAREFLLSKNADRKLIVSSSDSDDAQTQSDEEQEEDEDDRGKVAVIEGSSVPSSSFKISRDATVDGSINTSSVI